MVTTLVPLKRNLSTNLTAFIPLRAKRRTEHKRKKRDNNLSNDKEGFPSRVALARSTQTPFQLRAFRGETKRVMSAGHAEQGEKRDDSGCEPRYHVQRDC